LLFLTVILESRVALRTLFPHVGNMHVQVGTATDCEITEIFLQLHENLHYEHSRTHYTD
jgi:hypothetical protein